MSRPTLSALLTTAVDAVGGTERPGQVRMAEAVSAALDDGVHLLVEAGTGTGKSLAYLVPALAHHQRVVVATATLALQRQLIARDLPRTTTALAPVLGREPTYAILKGRNNYACLHRLYDGPVDDPDGALFEPVTANSPLAAEVLRVREWAQETDSGDRDDLTPGVSDRAWAQLSVSSRECLGATRCPYGEECFAELARARARDADIVVTNHAILAIDAVEETRLLPEHEAVVVDEAHELVARVTAASTAEIGAVGVRRAARRAARLLEDARARSLEQAAEEVGDLIDAMPDGRLTELAADLAEVLDTLRDACSAALGELAGTKDKKNDDEAARRLAVGAVEGVRDVAERVLSFSPYDVVWVERGERRPSALRVAPLAVSGMLRAGLFDTRTVVLTSATLRLGGEFDPVARSVGLDPADRLPDPDPTSSAPDADPAVTAADVPVPRQSSARRVSDRTDEADDPWALPPVGEDDSDGDDDKADDTSERGGGLWRALDVGSPFDYRRQGILYIARHLPPPGRDGMRPEVLDELAELIEAAGGRTLGLFSSMRGARAAAEELRERLPFPVRCQGESGLADLLSEFASDARSCLFGTLSLWQGVDVPGPACQLVTIDRIPFPRPDDPLMSARQRAADESGRNGFMTVAAAHAALLLAQGAGRLIRAAGDRGVVAVLDPRLATARYGGYLRASLPDFWPTADPAVVRRSLASIDASAAPVTPVSEGAALAVVEG